MGATDASLQQNNAAESRLLKSESGEKNTNNVFNSIQNLESVAEKLSWLPKNATSNIAFSIFLGLLMHSTLFRQSCVRLTHVLPPGSQSYSSIKAINVTKNQWLRTATKHTPLYANCADTAEGLMCSLQPNITFVSESCRDEHKNKKCLDGEMQDQLKWGVFVRNVYVCDYCSYMGPFKTTSDWWSKKCCLLL